MKAAVHTRYGPPDVVRITEIDKPAVGDNDVLVKIYATTVNRTDCGFRSGRPFIVRFFTGFPGPRAGVLGNEFAGVVAAVGSGVTSFNVGDRVFGYNDTTFGAHAEYLSIPERGSLALIPPNLSYEQAAPITEGSHYALAFIRHSRIQDGQDALVNGASGGIGSAAVQLLKSLGANVTAVCDTEHLELVRSLGANRVIDFSIEDFTQDMHTYDVVLDTVGKSTFGRCRRLLKPRGVYLSSELGPLGQNPVLALVTPPFRGRKVMFPFPRHDQEMAEYLRGLVESGQFRPLIDRRYQLDQIVEAYEYVETGQKIGNVVITVKSRNSEQGQRGSSGPPFG